MKLFKYLALLIVLTPAIASATITASWATPATTSGFIYPNPINGTDQHLDIGTTTLNSKLLMVVGNQSGGIVRFDRVTAGIAGSIFGTQDVDLWDTAPGNDALGPAETWSYTNGNTGVHNVLGQVAAIRTSSDSVGSLLLESDSANVANQYIIINGANTNVGIATTTPTSLFSIAGSSGIFASTTATSTFFGGGINLVTSSGNTGCFAVNSTCVGGLASTTADYIISTQGGITTALKTSTNTIISSSAAADVVIRKVIGDATSSSPILSNIYVSPGTYYLTATSSFIGNGNDNDYTFKIWGAGQDNTMFVVNTNTDGFYLTNRVKVDFRNFGMSLQGAGNGIVSKSGTSGDRSVWNSNFDGLFMQSTSTSFSGHGFLMGNDYRNTYNNIQFYQIANCIRAYAEGNGLQTGDSVYQNIMCSTINNTLSGTVAYDFDGTANSSANQVNDSVFTDVNAFANLGSKTAWRFNHALWMRVVSSNPEGFATTTEIYGNSNNNTINLQYAIGSTTASTYYYTDATSVNNVLSCGYLDSYSGTHKLFVDLNTDFKNPNILQGQQGANCDLRGSGTFTYSTTTASIVRDIEGNGAKWLEEVKMLGDKIVLNFAEGATQYIQAVGTSLGIFNNGHQAVTVDTSGNVGINNTSPSAPLDVSGTSILGNNTWVTQNTGGFWLDSYNSFNIGFYRDSSGNAFIRTNNTPRVTILNGGNFGIGTSTPGGLLSVAGSAGGTTALLDISSSTAAFATTTILAIDQNGALTGTTGPWTLITNGNVALNTGITSTKFGWDYNAAAPDNNFNIGGTSATFSGPQLSTSATQVPLVIDDNNSNAGTGIGIGINAGGTGNPVETASMWAYRTGGAGQGGMYLATKHNTLSSGVDGDTVAMDIDQNQNVAVGTSTTGASAFTFPALLFVEASSSANTAFTIPFQIASTTASNGAWTTLFSVSNSGHLVSSSTNPVLSSCGTAPTMTGDDTHGTITVGSAATACTLTFQIPYTVRPECIVQNETGSVTNTFSYSVTNAAITVNETALSGDLLDYECKGFTGQ